MKTATHKHTMVAATVLILGLLVSASAAAHPHRPPATPPPPPPPPEARVDAGTHFVLEISGGMGVPVGETPTDARTDLALKFGFGGRPGGSNLRLYWMFGLEGQSKSEMLSRDAAAPAVKYSYDTQLFTALRFLFPIAGNLRMFVDGGVGYGIATVETSSDWMQAEEERGYPLFYVAVGLQYRLFKNVSLGTEVTYMDVIEYGAPAAVLAEPFKDGVAAMKLTLTVHF
ncbi:MAG: outer membrane beta-barrel protein [Deltaproteobacteria bacterium]|nr:outer membrane beta-barrel protein [Deltaproteobacteria bacterium]